MKQEELRARLVALGARPTYRLRLTDNRTVMVSLSRRGVLSVHRGYADAPDKVLSAIVQFVSRGTRGAEREAARREILGYQVAINAPAARRRSRDRALPEDAAWVRQLESSYAALNARHFDGALGTLPIRISGRMRTRLGHLRLDGDGRPVEITISRSHLAAHDWSEVEHTLLHEMVHLWQHAGGHAVDHGPAFRKKAREVGAHAAARRWIRRTKGR